MDQDRGRNRQDGEQRNQLDGALGDAAAGAAEINADVLRPCRSGR
jgi:hypothetical protein